MWFGLASMSGKTCDRGNRPYLVHKRLDRFTHVLLQACICTNRMPTNRSLVLQSSSHMKHCSWRDSGRLRRCRVAGLIRKGEGQGISRGDS